MPSLQELASVPFLDAFEDQKRYNEQRGLQDIQKQSLLLDLHNRLKQQGQEQELRSTLAQTGGNVEAAMQAAIKAGNLTAAAKLAPLLEAQRKAKQPQAAPFRTINRGSETVNQELAPDGQWRDVGVGPRFNPDANLPEIVKMQRFAATLPEGSPQRLQLESAIKRKSEGEGGGSTFGAGLTGRSLSILTTMAPAFEAGQLTPDQERQFIAAATQYQQPTQFMDPATGLPQQRRPELPPFVAQALKRRGQRVPTAQPNPFTEPQPRPSQPGAAEQQQGPSVWDLASQGLLTGPIPAVGELAGRTPILGEFVQTPRITQARNYVRALDRDLVRVLQNNPRFSEGERKAIEKEISIDPSAFDTNEAYLNRLIGRDRYLVGRLQDAEATMMSTNVSREERAHAMDVANSVPKFRVRVRVPPTVNNENDWNALQSGSTYIDPEGNVRKKR